ncbi:MAG: type IV pilus modification PilV family protein [Pirellulales bacterium]|jgi:Tfp pilus assembly protein PilV
MRHTRAYRRRGFTLIEVTTAGVVMMIVMGLSVQVLGLVSKQHRAAERRRCALQEAANWMEWWTVQPWNAVTAENAKAAKLSEMAERQLPGGRLKIDVAADGSRPEAKRITIEVQWQNTAGEYETPARLVAWKFRGSKE